MLISIYADPHWCQYSSIIRKNSSRYSLRLENLINSVNWVETTSQENNCDLIICLGDFFDKSDLNSVEITALKEINWAQNIPHQFLVGNHDMGRADLSQSSSHVFSSIKEFDVIDRPCSDSYPNINLCYLPYVLEDSRKDISSYFNITNSNPCILFSHNDLKGIQMGKFISKQGFSIEEIESNFKLCLNGHLHNGAWVSSKILNCGNLTGQNFSEDAKRYHHCLYILNTDTLEIKSIENPFAFNFYKLDGIDDSIQANSVCTIRCHESNLQQVREWADSNSNIFEYRLVVEHEDNTIVDSIMDVESFSIDHLKQFRDYVTSNFENTEILLQELQEVLR